MRNLIPIYRCGELIRETLVIALNVKVFLNLSTCRCNDQLRIPESSSIRCELSYSDVAVVTLLRIAVNHVLSTTLFRGLLVQTVP